MSAPGICAAACTAACTAARQAAIVSVPADQTFTSGSSEHCKLACCTDIIRQCQTPSQAGRGSQSTKLPGRPASGPAAQGHRACDEKTGRRPRSGALRQWLVLGGQLDRSFRMKRAASPPAGAQAPAKVPRLTPGPQVGVVGCTAACKMRSGAVEGDLTVGCCHARGTARQAAARSP